MSNKKYITLEERIETEKRRVEITGIGGTKMGEASSIREAKELLRHRANFLAWEKIEIFGDIIRVVATRRGEHVYNIIAYPI